MNTIQAIADSTELPGTESLDHERIGCLHELFEDQVRLNPDAPALISGLLELSYAELNSRANQLARFLRLQGAGPGTFIALYFEKSVHPIISILACLKSGSA